MAPSSLPNANDVGKLAQHPALALRQRDQASTGTQKFDITDDRQRDSRNTQVVPEAGQSNHTAVTQAHVQTPNHTDTRRDDSLSPTKQNTMTQTQGPNQAQAPTIQNDDNPHSSRVETKLGPLSGPAASSDRGSTIVNPETRLILPSSTEDERCEAVDAILNEDSAKARIQDLEKHYIQEYLKGNQSAVVGSLREEVRRQIRAAALRGLANLEDSSSSIPNLNPQEQAAYAQLVRKRLMQEWARTPSAQQGTSPNPGSVRPESRSATPRQNPQHVTIDNRLPQATDAQPPTALSDVHPPQALNAESVTTSTEMMHPRTSDAADAGLMSGHHSRNSKKRTGDHISGSNNKRYRS